jgi:hypothetical protein
LRKLRLIWLFAAVSLLWLAGPVEPAQKKSPTQKKPTTAKPAAKKTAKRSTKSSAKKTASAKSKTTTARGRSSSARRRSRSAAARRSYRATQQQPAPERYTEIQQALAERGYYKGEANGKWDEASVEALKRFQEDQNLKPDGKLSSLSLIGLGLGPRRSAAISPARPGTMPDAPAPVIPPLPEEAPQPPAEPGSQAGGTPPR